MIEQVSAIVSLITKTIKAGTSVWSIVKPALKKLRVEPTKIQESKFIEMEKNKDIDGIVKEIGIFIFRAQTTVDNVSEYIGNNDGYKVDKYTEGGGYGYCINTETGKELGWLGIWEDLWAQNGDMFILQISDHKEVPQTVKEKYVDVFGKINYKKYTDSDEVDFYYIALDAYFKDNETDNKIADALLDKLRQLK
jgi:hypothetical protein